jgi:hypothetical protein
MGFPKTKRFFENNYNHDAINRYLLYALNNKQCHLLCALNNLRDLSIENCKSINFIKTRLVFLFIKRLVRFIKLTAIHYFEEENEALRKPIPAAGYQGDGFPGQETLRCQLKKNQRVI